MEVAPHGSNVLEVRGSPPPRWVTMALQLLLCSLASELVSVWHTEDRSPMMTWEPSSLPVCLPLHCSSTMQTEVKRELPGA